MGSSLPLHSLAPSVDGSELGESLTLIELILPIQGLELMPKDPESKRREDLRLPALHSMLQNKRKESGFPEACLVAD